MSGKRNRTAATRYNPSVDGESDTAKKKRDNAPRSTRSKSGSLKQPERFDFNIHGLNDTETQLARGETPGPTDAQEALDREAQEALDDRIEARFQFRNNLQARLRYMAIHIGLPRTLELEYVGTTRSQMELSWLASVPL